MSPMVEGASLRERRDERMPTLWTVEARSVASPRNPAVP